MFSKLSIKSPRIFDFNRAKRDVADFKEDNAKEVDSSKEAKTSKKGKTSAETKTSKPEADADDAKFSKILILGGTGQGKSTLINYILSFANGRKIFEPAIAIPNAFHTTPNVEGYENNEFDQKQQTASQTKQCTAYDVYIRSLKKWFRLIDTPGLNDTKGNKHDDANQAEIYNCVVNAKNLTAIVVVINGTNPRCTSDVSACLQRLKNSLPDSVMQNLVFVITCSHASSSNFDFSSLKPLTPAKGRIFYMNNSALSSDPATWREMKKTERQLLVSEWEMSMETIKEMFSMIAEMPVNSTKDFERMRQVSNDLKGRISKIAVEVAEIQKLQNELEGTKLARERTLDILNENKDYEENVEIEETQFEMTSYPNTRCTYHTDVVCHRCCGLEFTPSNNSGKIFSGCACMSNDTPLAKPKCAVCGCGPESHYHSYEVPVKARITIQKKLEKVYANFLAGLDELNSLEIDLNSKEGKLRMLQAAMRQKRADIEGLMRDLKSMCSGYNLVAELHGTIQKLEKDKMALKQQKAIQSATEFINAITKLAEELTDSQATIDGNKNKR